MTRRSILLRIESHLLDDWQLGEWCDTCLLPSMYSVTSVVVNRDTLDVIDRSRLHVCGDCGKHCYTRVSGRNTTP